LTSRNDVLDRAVRGGFPEAVAREPGRRARWFASYVTDLIERAVTQLSEIQRRPDLERLVRLLAARMATTVAIENLAGTLAVPRSTIDRYLALFEEVFLVKRIPAWSSSETGRAVHLRKLLFVDSGVGAHLSGRTQQRLRRDDALAGPLVENLVLGELARQLTWSDTYARLYHYRDRDGREIDAVLEHNDGRIVAIEVKAAASVHADDFRHLEALARKIGERLHRGIVLYTGNRTVPFGPRMSAVPIDALWGTP
jgi:predicted AAA+ superfamily ATPase